MVKAVVGANWGDEEMCIRDSLQPLLTEEEHAVYRRGRNAKSVSPAKNQSLTDYRRATGFEALMGWLYLKREWKRMADLIKIGLDHLSECEEEKKQEK